MTWPRGAVEPAPVRDGDARVWWSTAAAAPVFPCRERARHRAAFVRAVAVARAVALAFNPNGSTTTNRRIAAAAIVRRKWLARGGCWCVMELTDCVAIEGEPGVANRYAWHPRPVSPVTGEEVLPCA